MITVSDEDGQVPFEIVHANTFTGVVIPETAEELFAGVVTFPFPETTDHIPVPIAGTFPVIVLLGEQMV